MKAATRMATSEAGTQTIRIVPSSTPAPPKRSWEMMAAVAAETGEPVMPSEAEMTAKLKGHSGRILLAWAISLMMGSSE